MKKILFDQGVPVPLRMNLAEYEIDTVFERGWSTFSNGNLLDLAEQHGFEVFITTDQNLKYQQNLADRQLVIIVLLSTSWPRIQLRANEIKIAVEMIESGGYQEIEV